MINRFIASRNSTTARRETVSDLTRISLWGFVNAYLVPEDDGLTLIDTTLPRGARKDPRGGAELGSPIKRIALTHAHGDHIGALDRARRAAARRGGDHQCARRAADGQGHDARPRRAAAKLRGDYRGAKTSPTRTVGRGGAHRVAAGARQPRSHARTRGLPGRREMGRCSVATCSALSAESRPRRAMNPRFPFIVMGTWDRATELLRARATAGVGPAGWRPATADCRGAGLQAMDGAIERAS